MEEQVVRELVDQAKVIFRKDIERLASQKASLDSKIGEWTHFHERSDKELWPLLIHRKGRLTAEWSTESRWVV